MHCSVSELEKQTCPVNHFFALIVELDSGCDSFRTEDLNGGGGGGGGVKCSYLARVSDHSDCFWYFSIRRFIYLFKVTI